MIDLLLFVTLKRGGKLPEPFMPQRPLPAPAISVLPVFDFVLFSDFSRARKKLPAKPALSGFGYLNEVMNTGYHAHYRRSILLHHSVIHLLEAKCIESALLNSRRTDAALYLFDFNLCHYSDVFNCD